MVWSSQRSFINLYPEDGMEPPVIAEESVNLGKSSFPLNDSSGQSPVPDTKLRTEVVC